jgi:CheY-like chemotaxis protein
MNLSLGKASEVEGSARTKDEDEGEEESGFMPRARNSGTWLFKTARPMPYYAMAVSKCRILHVEDDPNDVLLVRRAFQKLSDKDELMHACDGEEAIAYLAGAGIYADRQSYPAPEVVLLDLKLPRKTGFEVLAWARNQPKLRSLPIVMLSSSREQRDVNRCYELGANSFLVKPVDLETLHRTLSVMRDYWCRIAVRADGRQAAPIQETAEMRKTGT